MSKLETAVFAGGCFWCTEAIFSRLRGVESVTSGYAGGSMPTPTYEAVSSGETGHAEVVKVVFDPAVVSYSQLLEVFWATHDPTTLNQQGADIGTQYRSIVLFTSTEQEKQAQASLREYQANLKKPIVTTIQPLEEFYTAEEYHQKFYENNPSTAYCSFVIVPKLAKLEKQFAHLLKEKDTKH